MRTAKQKERFQFVFQAIVSSSFFFRHREGDRERQGLIVQLREQNQRLTAELESASRREEELSR